jgi:hypothetical protein
MARRFLQAVSALLVTIAPSTLHAAEPLQWSGFALIRGTTAPDGLPLRSDSVSAQAQLGVDWRPSAFFGAHLHLLARTDDAGAKRGHAGVVEAYLQQKLDHFRFKEGAFFLPASRENIDDLWESPYSITPSALNSWMGEELRPIGVDASYTTHGFLAGATLFRGNDTFGALPAARGWDIRDDWTTLGEHLPVDDTYFSSVSAETDGRLGWSARGRWNNEHSTIQLTRIDNRSDAMEHGELFNWSTQFDIAGADYTAGDWTAAAESGWGRTTIIVFGTPYPTDIRASYALLSRRFDGARATLRVESFQSGAIHQHAVTAAFFWTPLPKLRAGFEATKAGADHRVMAELRYRFSR